MKKYFSIAGIRIILEYGTDDYEIVLDPALTSFGTEPTDAPEISFRVDTSSPFPTLTSYHRLFSSNPQGLWTMLEDPGRSHYAISLQNVEKDHEPYRIIRADRKFTDFIIYTRPASDNLVSPLEHPLADLAVSGYININRIGIILHSACVSIDGKGYLFAGVSGAGKSTISEIWREDPDAEVLTDERVLIRGYGNDLWAFGTPWHGTSEIHKNTGAPIGRIFFITHGKENKAVPISKTDAANRLMVRCFPALWHRGGMDFALDFCARIAEAKDSYELAFVKNGTIVEYLKKYNL